MCRDPTVQLTPRAQQHCSATSYLYYISVGKTLGYKANNNAGFFMVKMSFLAEHMAIINVSQLYMLGSSHPHTHAHTPDES